MSSVTPEATRTELLDVLLPDATRRLVRTADALTDEQHTEPSGLRGWTRAHVLAHLALNAEGLATALQGVVGGHRTPMYASQEDRDGDIEELAEREPTIIRGRLLGACTDLSDALAAVPADALDATIDRVPGGPTFPVADVPWMRLREVEIHHADLAAGYSHRDWSPAFSAHVLDATRTRGAAATTFSVRPVDLDRTWQYGEGGPTVSGAAADLAWWLTGRGSGEGLTSDNGELPRIGAW